MSDRLGTAASWKKAGLSVLGTIVGLTAAAYLFENWYGARELAAAKAEHAAAGFAKTPEELFPGPVPDEENFGALPLFREWAEEEGPLSETLRETAALFCGKGGSPPVFDGPDTWGRLHAELTSVPKPPRELTAGAADPLAELSALLETRVGTFFAEAEAGLDRPATQICPSPRAFWDRTGGNASAPMGNLVGALNFAKLAVVRAHLGVSSGRSDRAVSSLRVAWRSAAICDDHGFFLQFLVAESMRTLVIRGLHAIMAVKPDAFSTDEYRQLVAMISAVDHIQQAKSAILRERLWSDSFESSANKHEQREALLEQICPASTRKWLPSALVTLIPEGWWQSNLAQSLRFQTDLLKAASAGGAESAAAFDAAKWKAHPSLRNKWRSFYVRAWAGVGVNLLQQSGLLTEQCRTAATACALEAHKNATGAYPASLAELPKDLLPSIPLDLDGQPLRYRLTPQNGRYELWSVGGNLKDDGGKATGAAHSDRWKLTADDWVWRY